MVTNMVVTIARGNNYSAEETLKIQVIDDFWEME